MNHSIEKRVAMLEQRNGGAGLVVLLRSIVGQDPRRIAVTCGPRFTGTQQWLRGPTESAEDFRSRATSEAEAALSESPHRCVALREFDSEGANT